MSESTATPEEIYARAYSIDTMCFSAAPPINYVTHLLPQKIEALRTSGMTGISVCMTVPSLRSTYEDVKQNIADWDQNIAAYPNLFLKVTQAGHFDEAKRTGKVGLIFNLQNTTPFETHAERVAEFAGLGIRQVQLSHDYRNFVADGCRERTNAGLSKLGYRVVEELNDNRVIVDVTHAGEQSALEAILHSQTPVLFSHSGCYALCPHPRNVSDRNIRAMAERGGVFSVYNQSAWLTKDPDITIDHFIEHVAHVINIAGEDHVGMGTDGDVVDMSAMRPDEVERHQRLFDQDVEDFPQLTWRVHHMRVPELSHARRLLHLAQALDERKYTPRVIEKILGGNYVRLFREVVG